MNSTSASVPAIDLLLLQGKVRTCDPDLPLAEAVAIAGGRMVAVGSNADLAPLAGKAARVLDLGGRLLLPGFNDAHVHFYIGGDTLTSIDLRRVASPAEFREKMRRFVATRPTGEWILNGSWDQELWNPAE